MKRIREMNPYEKMKLNQLLFAIKNYTEAAKLHADRGDEVNLFMSLSKIQRASEDIAQVMEIK